MRSLYLITALLICFSISSCSRYYYKPNGVNVPMLTKAGDVHIDANGSLSSETINNGNTTNSMSIVDIKAAGSPVNHIGFMGGYSSYNFTTTTPDFTSGNVNARANLAEFGIGGYYAAGSKKVKMVVDLYGGVGFGSIKSDIEANVTRTFIQPGIGMHSPWFDVAFVPRIVNMKYSNFNALGRSEAYLEDKGLRNQYGRIDGGTYTFFEPSITMRAGYKFAKIQFQYVLSIPTTAMQWNASPGRFSVGLHLSIEDIISTIREENTKDKASAE